MLPGYNNTIKAFALKSLLRAPLMPNQNLAIAGDDEMSNVPLLIFTNQQGPKQTAVTPDISTLTYEQTAVKGAGDTLSVDNFVTDDFQLGDTFA